MPTDVVTAVDLVKRYKGKKTPAVDGISFDIAQGETVGLLGPNGAGKTTLIKMVCGVTPPTTGRLQVYGADPVRDPVAAKSAVGAMHQVAPFDEMLTVSDNLKIAARFRGLRWRSAQPWVEEIAEHLGLADEIFTRLAFQCSGGQRQRLQLVRALMTIPKLLILDEPSAGLDVSGRHQVERFVRWLRGEFGVTVLWTSHLMDEIERNCQRVMVINNGKVLRFAQTRELVREYSSGHLQVELEDQVGAKAVQAWAEAAGYAAESEDNVVRIDGKQTKDVLTDLARHCQDTGVAISGVYNITDSLEQVFLRMTEDAE
ncbi:ABC transporter ATP-binding protein [Actinospica robiniae]|uniref:ABC transporter ATP-binding protein n=1 Tax=Actinospica robiniae TaxID=304901 RepID=UPI000409408F|nr:ABC transporter ATP-binding protein [Actinospica robiniae]